MKDLSIGTKTITTLGSAFLGRPKRAKADSPVAVALIGAGGAVAAAGIAAGASVVVAVIAAGAVIAVAVLSGDGGEENEGDRTEVAPGPGGSQQQRTVGAADLPPAVRGFINRNIIMSASSLPSSSGSGDQDVLASAHYTFDGQITRFKPDTTRFNLQDTLMFRFTIMNIEQAEDAPLSLKVNELRLSTVDIPNTRGYSKVQFTAIQDDSVLWRWAARVNQGELPNIEGPSGISMAMVREDNDLLMIRNLDVPIKYKAPGANETTVVDIIMTVEGEGART